MLFLLLNLTFSQTNKQAILEAVNLLQVQALKVMPVIYLFVFTCAAVLNLVPHTRSEPYLLNIGLASMAIYLLLVFVSVVQIQSQHMLWLQVLTMLVCYWSFLHYAMNPKL
ncbi:hypothetical protein D0962_04530 [Leptolyngbyaceae cyanobacterium CCMR0082]|uniref:Uncharacterized protein n=1 Tax=Adonisia turfae CCMR0082 TaxID=2304604 RepID=A0A6M0S0Y3_9CYAN|nr:hypothetical protein [Adonisia turfae CCMR0082]